MDLIKMVLDSVLNEDYGPINSLFEDNNINDESIKGLTWDDWNSLLIDVSPEVIDKLTNAFKVLLNTEDVIWPGFGLPSSPPANQQPPGPSTGVNGNGSGHKNEEEAFDFDIPEAGPTRKRRKTWKMKILESDEEEEKEVEAQYVVEAILDKKMIDSKLHYLVKWKGWPDSDNSWEPSKNVKDCSEALRVFEEKHKERLKKLDQNRSNRAVSSFVSSLKMVEGAPTTSSNSIQNILSTLATKRIPNSMNISGSSNSGRTEKAKRGGGTRRPGRRRAYRLPSTDSDENSPETDSFFLNDGLPEPPNSGASGPRDEIINGERDMDNGVTPEAPIPEDNMNSQGSSVSGTVTIPDIYSQINSEETLPFELSSEESD